jgi:hypothetical protein
MEQCWRATGNLKENAMITINRRPFTGLLLSAAATGLLRPYTAAALAKQPEDAGAQGALEIAVDAYLYLYPLVTMGITRRQTNALPGTSRNSLNNQFFHVRTFPPANFKMVVRSNFDTLYSTAWLDLTREPMVVSVPDTGGRYYVLPMLDMWTDVFAAPGSRTSGTGVGHFVVVPPGWTGKLPDRVMRIDAPTPSVWIVGRTQTNGPQDYSAVHKIQDGYTITPLSQWGQAPPAPPPPNVPLPNLGAPAPQVEVDHMPALQYFRYAAELMKANPPHVTDWSTLERMQRIGIKAGQSYHPEQLNSALRDALTRSVAEGQRRMKARAANLGRLVNGWQIMTHTMGVYGIDYLKRAVVAQILLTANQPVDAVYPLIVTDADGKTPVGQNSYVLHFDSGALPPVGAFWSLSMYDAQGFQVANPISRFAIGSRDPLRRNADGSIDLYVQHDNPGGERTANWLPSPATGVLGLTMRLYAPKAPVLDGAWVPPPLRCQV